MAREDIVLNPYYQHMGGLYGSEYWTYLLPRRVGAAMTASLISPPFTPIGAHRAVRIGVLGRRLRRHAEATSTTTPETWPNGLPPMPAWRTSWRRRCHRRARDEDAKPLRAHRTEELARR